MRPLQGFKIVIFVPKIIVAAMIMEQSGQDGLARSVRLARV